MGHKEKTLEDLIAVADERIATLRGLHKDLKTVVREAESEREYLARDTASKVLDAANVELKALNEKINDVHARNIRTMRDELDKTIGFLAKASHEAWMALREASFADASPRQIAAVLSIVKSVVDGYGGWSQAVSATPDSTVEVINRMLMGIPSLDVERDNGARLVLHENPLMPIGTPHASLQDERTDVV